MNATILIIGQILLDFIILFLLIGFIRHSRKQKRVKGLSVDDVQTAEFLLKEMREITADLGKNLEQKKHLSRDILAGLDGGIERAEQIVMKIERINEAYGHQLGERPSPLSDKEQTRSSIRALMAKGFSREEIVRLLGISLGEIELLMKFEPQETDEVVDGRRLQKKMSGRTTHTGVLKP
jgi:hypothetical protein